MLTGKELGDAIESARKTKAVTKLAMAQHFGVKPPSINDWVKRGTIDKSRLPDLWDYFSDVVGPEHWGLKSFTPAGSTYSTDTTTQTLRAMEPPPRVKLSARAFSLASRLDALPTKEMQQAAYALMANILDLYEAQQAPEPAPRPATKSTPRAKQSPSRQASR